MTRPKLLSFSSVDLFNTCARKWFYEKIMGHRAPEGSQLLVGTAYHAVLAEIMRGYAGPLAEPVLRTVAAEGSKLAAAGVDTEALVHEMEDNLQRFREVVGQPKVAALPGGAPFIEQRFSDAERGYTGVIDAVLEETPVTTDKGKILSWKPGRCVVDFKTLSSDRRRSDRDARLSPQLGLYAIVTESPAAAFIEIPRDPDKLIQCRVVEYKGQELRNMEIWLVAMARTILSLGDNLDHYPMTERSNGLCAPMWCHMYDLCYGPKSPPAPNTAGGAA